MISKALNVVVLLTAFVIVVHAGDYSLIPKPQRVETYGGNFTLTPQTKIVYFASNSMHKYSAEY